MTGDDPLHGGRLVAERLKAHDVSRVFTLSGGHIFPIYDGCVSEEIDLVDVRHEAAAVFAAEGWAKVTREVGVAAVTAGPGVTNGMSAIASAQHNHSPLLVLGGRAPAASWGRGSLQEVDHVEFVAPVTKSARTPDGTEAFPGAVDDAFATARAPHSGPVFLDFPIDDQFRRLGGEERERVAPKRVAATPVQPAADGDVIEQAAALLRAARRPVVFAGTDLYWGHGEQALRRLVEELRIPTFLNGQGRGCLPADHELFFSRVRGEALKKADVALLIGVPMDFRLGLGGSFGEQTKIVAIDRAAPDRPHPRPVAAELYGDISATLDALREAAGPSKRVAWAKGLRERETEKRAGERAGLGDGRAPLHPLRIYAELSQLLDRDAIVICDGGDFVSFAGLAIRSYEPGCWLDPGPFGCLGCGPGYALAAKLAHPDRQVAILLGDGALGFSVMEYETLARHGVAVVGVVGNNGIWALEKFPMEYIYGYSVVADLEPERRYDEIAAAMGATGALVERPDDLRPALERAFEGEKPALVNVITDPSVMYPRRSNLLI
ncbi:MAG TPA: acetolactate synthase [Thermoleophilaceae bacterium]|nr:acetolactate synthase [Thermoleophilaceae bacterium]